MSDELSWMCPKCGKTWRAEPPSSCPTCSSFAAPALLDGWSVERRSYGVGTCFGGSGDVLCYGKWGVIGGTGRYKILHPTGWIEDSPKFKTEIEAMLWVKSQGKPKPSNTKLSDASDAFAPAEVKPNP